MPLGDLDRTLLRLSVGVCLGDWRLLRELRRGAGPGEPNRAWRETLLQAHLFAGFPRVVEALGVLGEEGGIGELEPEEADPEPDVLPRGRALFDRVYGRAADRVRGALEDGHPVLARWIEGHAYGRTLARTGLAPDRRELLAVASLASLGQDRQLASHVRGGLHCGASPRELREALEAVADLLDERLLRHALRVVERFAPV